MNILSCQIKTLGFVKNYSSTQSNDIIAHTLYHKYAASQNYYFTKEINEILSRQRTQATILFQDYLHLDEEDEFLKRFYLLSEFQGKLKLLTEFYKFHKDLPRFSIQKHILETLNYYYDKKRKINYYKIQRQIELENQLHPEQPAKGIVGEQPLETESTPHSQSSEPSNPQPNIKSILRELKEDEQKKKIEISRISKNYDEQQQSELTQIITLLNTPQTKMQYQIFKKQKQSFKKQLKLDDIALSSSIRHQNFQDQKMPLSARYPSYSLSKIQQKHQSLSKEKNDNTQHFNKENLVQLFNKYPQQKRQKNDSRIHPKHQLLKQIPDIKQLELKIIKSLQEIEKNKSTHKVVSFDSKALHQILSKFNQPTSARHIKQIDSFKSQSNQSISLQKQKITQKIFTPRNNKGPVSNTKAVNAFSEHLKKSVEKNQIVKTLNLKKLMVYKQDKIPKTERVKKTVPILNFNGLSTNNQSSYTSRNLSGTPSFIQLLTPKPQSVRNKINNLIHWQVKAIQAAQRDYKFNLNK